jgi:hypothetical protein
MPITLTRTTSCAHNFDFNYELCRYFFSQWRVMHITLILTTSYADNFSLMTFIHIFFFSDDELCEYFLEKAICTHIFFLTIYVHGLCSCLLSCGGRLLGRARRRVVRKTSLARGHSKRPRRLSNAPLFFHFLFFNNFLYISYVHNSSLIIE